MSVLLKKLENIEAVLKTRAGQYETSVYGIVDRVVDGVPNVIRCWKGIIGKMESTTEKPTILLIEKLEPLILKHKKYKCVFGGRAGTKVDHGHGCDDWRG